MISDATGFWPMSASSPRKRIAATPPFLKAADPLGRVVMLTGARRPLPPAGQAEGPDPGQATAGLPQACRNRPRDLGVRCIELDVEGDQRLTGGDERRSGGGVRLGRAEVGLELAR